MKDTARQPAEARPRADAADRGAADRRAAAAPRPAGPARTRASVAAAGDAIFSNLGLLFAIGVAVGLARENHGAAGLAGVVAYLVATKGAEVLIDVPPEALADLSGRARDLAAAAYKAHELAKLSVPVGHPLRADRRVRSTTASTTSRCRAT